MKPMLKAPVTKRLKLKYGKLLSSCAFNLNLRRYMKVETADMQASVDALQRKVDALMMENANVKKDNKKLVMQRRVAVAVARDVGQRMSHMAEATGPAGADGKAPKEGAGEQGKGSKACAVM